MSITDELRGFMAGADGYELWCPHHKAELTSIADRIDAEYQKAEDEWKAKGGQSWLHGYEECHLELMEGNEAITASLEEAGWYRVLDADKQPIHIGDELDSDHCEDGTVVGLQFFEEANGVLRVFIAIRPHGWDTPTWRVPDSYRHHHEPTLEDVLAEFALEIDPSADIAVTGAETIKKFAAKLQLKEPNE